MASREPDTKLTRGDRASVPCRALQLMAVASVSTCKWRSQCSGGPTALDPVPADVVAREGGGTVSSFAHVAASSPQSRPPSLKLPAGDFGTCCERDLVRHTCVEYYWWRFQALIQTLLNMRNYGIDEHASIELMPSQL